MRLLLPVKWNSLVVVFPAQQHPINTVPTGVSSVPPTVEELERRLTGRGTETAQVIADRLARAGEEAEGMGQYDYILVNDTVEECVDHLHQIIVSEHSRVSRNAEFIADIQKQTKAFQK